MREDPGRLIRIIDGDSARFELRIEIDEDLTILRNVTVRLKGVDTPELHSESANERIAAKAAMDAHLAMVQHRTLRIVRYRLEKYGRWLSEVFTDDSPLSTSQRLIDMQHGIPYDGGRRGVLK